MIWWLDLALPFPPLFRPCLYQVYSREEQLVFVYDTENETRNVQWKNGAVIHKWSQRQADTHKKPIPEYEMKTCCEIAMLCNQSELCKVCNYKPFRRTWTESDFLQEKTSHRPLKSCICTEEAYYSTTSSKTIVFCKVCIHIIFILFAME